MAKRRTKSEKKKAKSFNQIDNISNYTQQPRSPGSKRRRTDFSHFFSSSLCNSGSLLGPSRVRDRLSSVTISCSDDCGSKTFEAPEMETDLVVTDAVVDHHGDREVDKEENDSAGILEYTQKKSEVVERNGVCITPGNVVWAKTACQMWWPAEIIEEKPSFADSANEGVDGHVLVQFYGNSLCAWVDPATELSQLEDCFEERCSNSTENFQDALKQALIRRKEHISSCRKFLESPDRSFNLDQENQLSDKWTSSISSVMERDLPERGRGKRERKPKFHYDEVTFPLKSTRKIRRYKIMRYLGLIAPLGSPF